MQQFNAILLGVWCLATTPLLAQNTQIQRNRSHQEIDEQVWKPFVKAYNAYDAWMYNYLHSDDILRVYPGHLREGKSYKKYNEERFKKAKKEGRKRVLEFKFIECKATKKRAYEVGFSK